MSKLFLLFILIAGIAGYVSKSWAIFFVALIAGAMAKVMINLNQKTNE